MTFSHQPSSPPAITTTTKTKPPPIRRPRCIIRRRRRALARPTHTSRWPVFSRSPAAPGPFPLGAGALPTAGLCGWDLRRQSGLEAFSKTARRGQPGQRGKGRDSLTACPTAQSLDAGEQRRRPLSPEPTARPDTRRTRARGNMRGRPPPPRSRSLPLATRLRRQCARAENRTESRVMGPVAALPISTKQRRWLAQSSCWPGRHW